MHQLQGSYLYALHIRYQPIKPWQDSAAFSKDTSGISMPAGQTSQGRD